MEFDEVMARLEALGDPEAAEGMARFGITAKSVYGASMPDVKALAKEIGRDHDLALRLWEVENREARILAALVDDHTLVTEEQVDRWVEDFDSWEVTDQCIGKLFDRTPWAYEKAVEWSAREEEFVKRAGFVMMATLAVHDKRAPDERFYEFLPIIAREAGDGRNFVKKAVNWALRQIGKRSLALNAKAVEAAEGIHAEGTRAGRRVTSDALRELRSERVLERLRERASKETS